jgi:hypothetical protein
MRTTIKGRCHCGNVCFEIATDLLASAIEARACDCSFCRTHRAKNWSDPKGLATVTVKDAAQLQRYRFALRTADFYICRTCGAYVGAVISDRDGAWSTLNLRLTDLHDAAERPASYGAEQTADRVERRKKHWTPTRVSGLPR